MKSRKKTATQDAMEQTLSSRPAEHYVLNLYVTGATPSSVRAIRNLRRICEENLAGRYELCIYDIYQQPALARQEQLIAAPTLIKRLPLPVRRVIGDMSDKVRVLLGLGLSPEASIASR